MLTSLLVAVVLAADPGTCPRELFRIERTKNANVVLYETNPGQGAALNPDEPIVASWQLLATTGKREPLTFFERVFAYGFETRLAPSADSCSLTLKALKGRTIRVANRGDCLSAFAVIGGADAVLQKIFVQTDERGPAPAVQYIELFGVDPATGEARYEKVLRGKGSARGVLLLLDRGPVDQVHRLLRHREVDHLARAHHVAAHLERHRPRQMQPHAGHPPVVHAG